MPHRETIKEYLGKIRLDGVSVVDWGCGTKPAIKYVRRVKDVTYIGLDKLEHVGADIVCDIEEPLFLGKDGSFASYIDIAFCMEVLEHTENPDSVLKNIHSNLKDGGILYFSVPFLYPVHSTHDLWRFTDQGIALLLKRNGFKLEELLPTEGNMGWVGKAVKTKACSQSSDS